MELFSFSMAKFLIEDRYEYYLIFDCGQKVLFPIVGACYGSKIFYHIIR